MFSHKRIIALSLATIASAQQPAEYTPEVHPSLPSEHCTKSGGCKTVNSSVVLDSGFRWLHNKGGYDNCVTTGFDPTICPNATACSANCVLEGVDYSGYGISTAGDAVTLDLFVTKDNVTSLSSPRIYLLDERKGEYLNFQLVNQEFTFDVDLSKVPCGVNGALYFSEMDLTGGKDASNPAGAAYGTGYCDAQCPTQNFINGQPNFEGYGACCNEMDIWEANNAATAYTPHPCNITSIYACEEPLCGTADRYGGVCDKDGCDFNPYRQGNPSYYGEGNNMTIDTLRPFTIVTQFLSHDNSTNGTLAEIRRLYVQDGLVIENARSQVPDIPNVDSITDSYCAIQKEVFGGATNAFATQGGLEVMGQALARGMTLAMAIWYDSTSYMQWLDSTTPPDADPATTPGAKRGSCPTTGGRPEQILANSPDSSVTFSKIKWGDIGTTFGGSNGTTVAYGKRERLVRH